MRRLEQQLQQVRQFGDAPADDGEGEDGAASRGHSSGKSSKGSPRGKPRGGARGGGGRGSGRGAGRARGGARAAAAEASSASPVTKWEQYSTPPHLAAHILFTAENSYGDISDRVVADLGCGCGILTVGSLLLESSFTVGIDIDSNALSVAQSNCEEFDITNVDFVQGDVVAGLDFMRNRKSFDTVIMNPPFGTKSKGVDMAFLASALKIAPVVYSLHKTSTREYILKKAEQLGARASVLAELRWDLGNTYKFHKKESVDIEVDFFREPQIMSGVDKDQPSHHQPPARAPSILGLFPRLRSPSSPAAVAVPPVSPVSPPGPTAPLAPGAHPHPSDHAQPAHLQLPLPLSTSSHPASPSQQQQHQHHQQRQHASLLLHHQQPPQHKPAAPGGAAADPQHTETQAQPTPQPRAQAQAPKSQPTLPPEQAQAQAAELVPKPDDDEYYQQHQYRLRQLQLQQQHGRTRGRRMFNDRDLRDPAHSHSLASYSYSPVQPRSRSIHRYTSSSGSGSGLATVSLSLSSSASLSSLSAQLTEFAGSGASPRGGLLRSSEPVDLESVVQRPLSARSVTGNSSGDSTSPTARCRLSNSPPSLQKGPVATEVDCARRFCLAPPPYTLQKFFLYETPHRFYLVGSNKNDTSFHVLKIERFVDTENPNRLNIIEDPASYTKDEIEKLFKFHPLVATPAALLGFIQLLAGYYMIFAAKRKCVGVIGGHCIFAVQEPQFIYIPSSSPPPKLETRYRTLLQAVDLSSNFFFSYTYNLTRTLQYNMEHCWHHSQTEEKASSSSDNDEFLPLPPQYDDMFMWNHYLVQPLLICKVSPMWILPLVHGDFIQSTVMIHRHPLSLSLIARRSRHYAGTRFLKRGLSESGHVANHVEIEQIVQDCSLGVSSTCALSSYVQVRGSIPLFWHQDTSSYNPKPPIILDRRDPFCTATIRHFQDLLCRYGAPLFVLTLIKTHEKNPRESTLLNPFLDEILFLNKLLPPEISIRYKHWDISHALKHGGGNYLTELFEIANDVLQLTSFFHSGNRTSMQFKDGTWNVQSTCKKQQGVLRTNCVDSLDRTNAAQFFVGKCALGNQLYAMGYFSDPSNEFDKVLFDTLVELYEKVGNTIATQYAGSQLANTVKTYTRASASSFGRDLFQTMKRYYSNSFTDTEKQHSINVFLGMYIPLQHLEPLWNFHTDYYLHNTPQSDPTNLLCTTDWWSEPLAYFTATPGEHPEDPPSSNSTTTSGRRSTRQPAVTPIRPPVRQCFEYTSLSSYTIFEDYLTTATWLPRSLDVSTFLKDIPMQQHKTSETNALLALPKTKSLGFARDLRATQQYMRLFDVFIKMMPSQYTRTRSFAAEPTITIDRTHFRNRLRQSLSATEISKATSVLKLNDTDNVRFYKKYLSLFALPPPPTTLRSSAASSGRGRQDAASGTAAQGGLAHQRSRIALLWWLPKLLQHTGDSSHPGGASSRGGPGDQAAGGSSSKDDDDDDAAADDAQQGGMSHAQRREEQQQWYTAYVGHAWAPVVPTPPSATPKSQRRSVALCAASAEIQQRHHWLFNRNERKQMCGWDFVGPLPAPAIAILPPTPHTMEVYASHVGMCLPGLPPLNKVDSLFVPLPSSIKPKN
ncbi:phosphatidylinositol-3,5-bisphosphate 5-phosphatase [Pelomyxa schiedti]|nr:phosphatidylinositol-3,5-bisphosphate 5-phosphatase [Pelomyxa schiedti]